MDALDHHNQNVDWLAKFVDDANVNEIIIMSYCSVCFYKEFVIHGGSLFSYVICKSYNQNKITSQRPTTLKVQPSVSTEAKGAWLSISLLQRWIHWTAIPGCADQALFPQALK